MAAVLALAIIVAILAVMWATAIVVDRHLEKKWNKTLEEHWAEWHAETVEEDPLTPEREQELD